MIPEMRATATFFAGKPRASGDDPDVAANLTEYDA